MQIPSWLSALAAWALSLAIPVLLVATPLYIYISPGFVRHEYGLKHIPPAELFFGSSATHHPARTVAGRAKGLLHRLFRSHQHIGHASHIPGDENGLSYF